MRTLAVSSRRRRRIRTLAVASIVDGYPGLYRDLLTYLRERIKEVLTGASATIVVRVYGPDLQVLQAQAQAVRNAIAKVQGVADLTVQAQVLVPKVEVRFDPERAAALQVPVASGGAVPLRSVSSVEVTPTPNEITRENGSRRIDVTSNVRGRDLGAVARDIEAELGGLVTVVGISARNGIVLISHYRHLELQEGMTSGATWCCAGPKNVSPPFS
jgi:Cu/Ag efflux pump CusA